MRSKFKYFIAAGFIFIFAILMMNRFSNKNNPPYVRIGSVEIPVELAIDAAAQQKGLSGRPSLDPNNGILFIFSRPAIYTFWMRYMNFPIDIIWINDDKVIDISANVSNDFDPKNPTFYEPVAPAQYVLEVNANFAEKENIKIGDSVSFINISN